MPFLHVFSLENLIKFEVLSHKIINGYSIVYLWISHRYYMKNYKMKRIAIYPKDIMIITGKSERYSREVLKKIRNHFQKPRQHKAHLQSLESVDDTAKKLDFGIL